MDVSLVAVLCLWSFVYKTYGSTEVTEDILVDSTFYKNLGPYLIKKPVTIKSGAILSIQAGTQVQVLFIRYLTQLIRVATFESIENSLTFP